MKPSQAFSNLTTLPRAARRSIREWRTGRSASAYSMAALQPLIGDQYLPWNHYSVTPDLARQVCNEVVINRRFSIIEFGSGLMTVILVALARNLDLPLSIASVDEDERWLETVQGMIGDTGPASLELIQAPLVEYAGDSPFDNPFSWYDPASLAGIEQSVQLGIVDGPARTGADRWPAMPWLQERLAPGCAVVLDDVHLSGIRAIGRDWERRYAGEFEVERQSLVEWYRRGDCWEVD